MSPKTTSGLDFEVLLYREDGMWVALALELNVIGTGTTADAAAVELIEAIESQLSFAQSRGNLDTIWRQASNERWEQWRAVKQASVLQQLQAAHKATVVDSSEEMAIRSISVDCLTSYGAAATS